MTHPGRPLGEFSVCHVTYQEPDEDGYQSDNEVFRTLKWNYDTAEQAWADVPAVAAEEGVPPEECRVVQVHDRDLQ